MKGSDGLRFGASVLRELAYPRKPSLLVLFVTSQCNCRCSMCFNLHNVENAHLQTDLSLDAVTRIASSLRPLPQLLLSGGEPFVRNDLPEIIRSFYEQAELRQLSIPTNGTLTRRTADVVETIIRSCPKLTINLNFSLDGVGATHDTIRGRPGTYAELAQTYQHLVQLRRHYGKPNLNILTVVTPGNAGELDALLRHVEQEFEPNYHALGIDRTTVTEPETNSVVSSAENTIGEFYERGDGFGRWPNGAAIASAIALVTHDLMKRSRADKARRFECLAGQKLIVITNEGQMFPCEPLWLEPGVRPYGEAEDFLMANLKDYAFDVGKALESSQAQRVIDFVNAKQCWCNYGCAITNGLIYSPRSYPRLGRQTLARIARRKLGITHSTGAEP